MSHPDIALDLMAHTNENTIQKVIDEIIDVGIVYSKPRHPLISSELLQEDSFVLVGRDKSRTINLQSLNSAHFIFVDWGKPFMSWFDERVGQQFIPAFKINQTALVINYLISGDFFGFVPKSFAFPYLQKGEIHELHHEFPFKFPEYNIYVIYLKNKKDSLTTKLGLERLRI